MGPRTLTDISELGDEIIRKLGTEKLYNSNSRLVLLIYGEPGSGKTTYSEKLVQYLNTTYGSEIKEQPKQFNSQPVTYQGTGGLQTQICQYVNEEESIDTAPFAVHLKMDGFHIPLSGLTPELKKKRGCQESFDSTLVVKLVELLTNQVCDNSAWSHLTIPDFDHSIKDPTNPGICIEKKTKIVVLEGLYLMLKIEPWCKIPRLVEVMKKQPRNFENSIQIAHIIGGNQEESAYRVGLRHLNSGLVSSYDEGIQKYFASDTNNAKVVENQSVVDFDDWIIDNSTRL